ncbi:MAG TPA: hypothetical protein VKG24_10470 [Pseudolabrys sp.]|nr:hypothetical protein [Pseudolabrys sp.]
MGEGDAMKKLRQLARAVIEKAEAGDLQAFKEVADRMDGKPAQMLEHVGEGEQRPQIIFNVTPYVRPQIDLEANEPPQIEHATNGNGRAE